MKYETKKKAILALGSLFGSAMLMTDEDAMEVRTKYANAIIVDNELDKTEIEEAQAVGARVFSELVANAKKAKEEFGGAE